MQASSEQVIQRLGRRYFGVLGVVALLLVVDQVALQPALVRLNFSAPLINLAGRQRMLSQKLAKSAMMLSVEKTVAGGQELKSTLDQWTAAHSQLTAVTPGQLGTQRPSSPISQGFTRLEPDFTAMRSAVERILKDEQPVDSLKTLLQHEPAYLSQMDQIVGLYERQTQSRVQRLRVLSAVLTALALLLIAGMSWLILHPATTVIRGQVRQLVRSEAELRDARDALEERVAHRTRELQVAHDDLAAEAAARRESEEHLRQLQGKLSHAARLTSLGQLATGLAHELNQPLGAITNYAEALDVLASRPEPPSADLQHAAQRIRAAALRAGQIVLGMRDMVRPSQSRVTLENLSDLVREVLLLCEYQTRKEGVVVLCNVASDGAPAVRVNRIQIQQVLLNLLQNSLQAMRETPRDLRRLSLTVQHDQDWVLLSCEDSGPGFPADKLPLRFQPFESTKLDGLGMGLSICQNILTAHGGAVTAENVLPRGARLTLRLPHPDQPLVSDRSYSVCRG